MEVRRGTCIFFHVKHVSLDPSGWMVFMTCEANGRTIVMGEELPAGYGSASPSKQAVQLAKALRILLDGDSQSSKHHRLGCPPGADPDNEFFFATDTVDLAARVSAAMASLPNTRTSIRTVSWMPHYHGIVPVGDVWELYLAKLRSELQKGTAWRETLRLLALALGAEPKISAVDPSTGGRAISFV